MRIKINDRQGLMLTKLVMNESNDYEFIIKNVVDDLNFNYEPTVGMYREGGEYFEQPIVKIKADGEMVSPEHLFYYLEYKHKSAGKSLLKQIILDWLNGDIKNYTLTKNVGLR